VAFRQRLVMIIDNNNEATLVCSVDLKQIEANMTIKG